MTWLGWLSLFGICAIVGQLTDAALHDLFKKEDRR